MRTGETPVAASDATPSVRRGVLPALGDLLARWRTCSTAADLLATAPRDIVAVGFDRCLVSRVDDGRWIAQSSYVRGDSALAHAITRAGSEVPVPLDRRLLESELVSTRAQMLVRDAKRNPRVHRRLVDVTASTAYVATPVVLGGAVVGFVHVDRTAGRRRVDDEDVEVIGLIGECLGSALERVAAAERLAAMRASLASWSSTALSLLDERPVTLSTPGPGARDGIPPQRPGRPPQGPWTLTARELEVLERIAAGERNAEIAAGLFITPATVKAHVKHIFRKLGVANRAEAVSTYLRR